MIKERKIIISGKYKPLRLDQFLKAEFPFLSRGYIKKTIKRENILVNNKVGRKGDVLKQGDLVYIKEILSPKDIQLEPNPNLPINIIYEDKDIIVIDKPSGIPSHPIDFEENNTVANFLIAEFSELMDVGEKPLEPGMVHRLDTNTSGLILIARNEKAFEKLKYDQQQGKIIKEYLALVIGGVKEGWKIGSYIGHHPKDERKMKVFSAKDEIQKYKAKKARTLFEVDKRYNGYTLLKVRIEKGLMHQIRVHLASTGHPIAGDKLYQTKRFRKLDVTGLERQFLHASGLEFYHPLTGKYAKFSSQVPKELGKVLRNLKYI